MLHLFTGGFILGIGVGVYKYFNKITTAYRKYNKLVSTFQYRYPDMWLVMAYIKALKLILYTKWILFYQYMTSVTLQQVTIVKYVIGGNYEYHLIKHRKGPRKHIEYAYIDEIPYTELVQSLAGIHNDFSGNHEWLLELGNCVRYKFYDEEEIKIEKMGNELIKKDNLKKMMKFYMTS